MDMYDRYEEYMKLIYPKKYRDKKLDPILHEWVSNAKNIPLNKRVERYPKKYYDKLFSVNPKNRTHDSDNMSKYKGVRCIEKYLREHKIEYVKEHTFNDCLDKKLLRFDVAIVNKGEYVMIEFDGEQHYKPVSFGSNCAEDVFKRRMIHDEMKNQYCKEHGIKLIRISYKDIKNINSILNKELG